MTLKEKLMLDLKEAMKNKDEIRKNTIQLIRSAVLQVEKDNKVVLQDDGIIDVIAKQLKKRKEALPDYERSGRQDLINNINKEIEILTSYLPQQMSEEELEKIVKEAITSTGAVNKNDIKKVMAQVMPKVKGRADGSQVNKIVMKLLE